MTKIKKISKIIPAVLLSGAMVVPVSQLTSPVIAHAYENSAYTQKAIDYTPTITKLVDAELNSPQSRSVQRTNNNDVVVPTNGEIKVNLEEKDYHEFKAKLVAPKDGNTSVRYKVYLDDRQIRDTGNMKPGEEKDLLVELFNDDAKELKIVATNSSNARANNSGVIENGNFTTYYTDCTEAIGKKEEIIRTQNIRATGGSAYIGTHNLGGPVYLNTTREIIFGTYSSDPSITKKFDGQVCEVSGGPTVRSEKGIHKQVNGHGYSVTVGASVQYKVIETMRVRQYYNANGNIIRSHAATYKTYEPVPKSVTYSTMRL